MVIMPSFKFFKVPFDVRLIIYEYLFVGTQMTVKHTKICPGDCVAKKRSLKDCKENLTYELAFSPPQSLDALRTCRQFYKEAFRVLASQTTHLRLPETMVKAGCELFAAPTPPKWRLLKAILPFITCVELPTDLPFDFRLVPQLSHLIVPIDFDLADGPYDCVKRLAKELNRDDCIRGAQVLAAYSREVYWKPAASYEESLKPCEGVTMHCKSIWSHGKQVNGTDTFVSPFIPCPSSLIEA